MVPKYDYWCGIDDGFQFEKPNHALKYYKESEARKAAFQIPHAHYMEGAWKQQISILEVDPDAPKDEAIVDLDGKKYKIMMKRQAEPQILKQKTKKTWEES